MKTRLRDGSGHRHYRYLYEDTDRHGNVRVYFWRGKGQPKIRIKVSPGTAEFDREYQLAFEGKTAKPATGKADPGSLQWLCEQYYSSVQFKALDIRTRKVRRSILEAICRHVGKFRYAMMRPQDVAKLRDAKSVTPAAANQLVQSIRSVFAWACDPEYALASANPAAKTKFLATNPDGFKPWTEADVIRYCEFYPTGTRERLAIDLMLFTGCRRSDVIRLGPQMERSGALLFTEFKGRRKTPKTHRMPVLPALRASIDATPATGQLAYLVNRYGQPFKPETFSKWFASRCKAAGIDAGLSAHGLRKYAAQWCVENGATDNELMALFGWRSKDMASLYTRKADRALMESKALEILSRRKV